MPSLRVDACIVGGGPAGLLLGLLLAKRGAEVLVLEGHEDFERAPLPPLDPELSFRSGVDARTVTR